LLAAASVVATALNYVFLLATGRLLGADDYGALAALLGVVTAGRRQTRSHERCFVSEFS
jgi:O-antigen/teichoic acid export membrane protein